MKHTALFLTILLGALSYQLKTSASSIDKKYVQFLSCFSDSTYYAIENISGHEVLLVSNEVFLDESKEYKAIAAQLYTLDTKGNIEIQGEARSQGTLYPLAISGNTLMTAGHHYVNRYMIDKGQSSLYISESASEAFNKKGKAKYHYENRQTNEYTEPKNDKKLANLFAEFEKARSIIFQPCTNEGKHKFIKTAATGLNAEILNDTTVAASFTCKDFDWNKWTLTMEIYAEQEYEKNDIEEIQEGDSILYSNDTIIVRQKEESNGEININGGLENNGVTLQKNDNGKYRTVVYDDHSTYTRLCKTKLPLSKDFTITDCHEDPQEPAYTIRDKQRTYINNLKASRRQFTNLDTKVKTEHGYITSITRRWIP